MRASGIHARYQYGTIDIQAPKIVNWLKVNDINAAMDLLSQVGIPHQAIVMGGSVKYIRMEHVWVAGWIDYFPSRGARHRIGDSWWAMDAAYKQHEFVPGLSLEEAVPFEQQRLLAAVPTPAAHRYTQVKKSEK